MPNHKIVNKQFAARLRNSAFFSQLDSNHFDTFVVKAKQLTFQTGETIFHEGDPPKGLYWLSSGTVKAFKVSPSGKEQILHIVKAGNTFNEVGAFSTLPNPASIIALETAVVWCIPAAVIREQVQLDPTFAQLVIDTLAARLRHSVTLIESLSLRSVTKRLSRLILEEAEGDTLFRPNWLTQYELAARLGTVEDVIRRSLRKLESSNVIEVSRQQINIADREKLEQIAS